MSLGLCLNSVRTKMWSVSNVDHGHGPGLLVNCVWGICNSDSVPQNNCYTMKLLITIYIYTHIYIEREIDYKVIFPSNFSCRIMLLKFSGIKDNYIYIYIYHDFKYIYIYIYNYIYIIVILYYIYIYLKSWWRNRNVWTGYFFIYYIYIYLKSWWRNGNVWTGYFFTYTLYFES